MDNASASKAYAPLRLALADGADAAAIGELVAGLGQETAEERQQAHDALLSALNREADVFQVVLDAMCKEVILPSPCKLSHALSAALKRNNAPAVMAIAERMRSEAPYELSPWLFVMLFRSDLFRVPEVVNAVLDVVPAATFRVQRTHDPLSSALRCKEAHKVRAVELILKHGPPMEERLKVQKRFEYVCVAARSCNLRMVQMMHDLVPLLPDGSGRRGEVADYAEAVRNAGQRDKGLAPVYPILDYLADQGGDEILDEWHVGEIFETLNLRATQWMAARVPHLLEAACREDYSLYTLVDRYHRRLSPSLMEQLLKAVDREVIVELMRQEGVEDLPPKAPQGWRWKLEVLHKGVPECMDGLRFPWLMSAVRDKAYKDVKYMLDMCTREHLVMRDDEGLTVHDVAAEDIMFPRQLLGRLKVVTKGAHA